MAIKSHRTGKVNASPAARATNPLLGGDQQSNAMIQDLLKSSQSGQQDTQATKGDDVVNLIKGGAKGFSSGQKQP